MTSATLPQRSAAQPPSPLYVRAHELDERVRHLGLRRRKDKAAMANALLELKESGLYKFLGYASMTAYGQTVEGLGPSTTSELLKVADGVRRRGLPKIRAEFEAGLLPSAKAVVLVEVATPKDEEVWLERSRRHQPRRSPGPGSRRGAQAPAVLRLDPHGAGLGGRRGPLGPGHRRTVRLRRRPRGGLPVARCTARGWGRARRPGASGGRAPCSC